MKLSDGWDYAQPPNETLVEVEYDNQIIRVMAFHGRDGIKPQWTDEGRVRCWSVESFRRWRPIKK